MKEFKNRSTSSKAGILTSNDSSNNPVLLAEWAHSFSLGPYFAREGGTKYTKTGLKVYRYKYGEETEEARNAIATDLAAQAIRVMRKHLWPFYYTLGRHSFDKCLGVPGNRNSSLPISQAVCTLISTKLRWVDDYSDRVEKKRAGQVLKTIERPRRPATVQGLYRLNTQGLARPRRGVLIVDDIYDTGSTMNAMFWCVREAFGEEVPITMLTLTHIYESDRFLS